MREVLISIQPKWCELIANGKKTVEVRKTRPKLETPFKVYIYCTNTKPYLAWGDVFRGGSWETEFSALRGYSKKDAERIFDIFNGKVIGEFVCDDIQPYNENALFLGLDEISCSEIEIKSCVDLDDLLSYKGDEKYIYGWHISDLVIYDEPKELGEFRKYNPFFEGISTEELEAEGVSGVRIKRPPQSWCYVEGGEL